MMLQMHQPQRVEMHQPQREEMHQPQREEMSQPQREEMSQPQREEMHQPQREVMVQPPEVMVQWKRTLVVMSALKDNVIMPNVNMNLTLKCALNNALRSVLCAGSDKILVKITAQS